MTKFVSATGTILTGLLCGLVGTAAHAEAPENLALVTGFFETTLNAGDVAALDQIMAEDYIQHNPFVPQGRDGFRAGLAEFRAAFPDYSSRIDKIVATDDEVWVLHTASGTHCAAYFGMPPTERRFEVQVTDIFRIAEGRLAEHWDVFPAERMMAQLSDAAAPTNPGACD
jgi:steroid delta-isomerase-like uncharacterized protein